MRKVLLAVAAATLAVLPAASARAQRGGAGAMDPVAGGERGDAHGPMALDCPPGVEASPTVAGGGAGHDLHRAIAAGR